MCNPLLNSPRLRQGYTSNEHPNPATQRRAKQVLGPNVTTSDCGSRGALGYSFSQFPNPRKYTFPNNTFYTHSRQPSLSKSVLFPSYRPFDSNLGTPLLPSYASTGKLMHAHPQPGHAPQSPVRLEHAPRRLREQRQAR